jgi:hypothetical protein
MMNSQSSTTLKCSLGFVAEPLVDRSHAQPKTAYSPKMREGSGLLEHGNIANAQKSWTQIQNDGAEQPPVNLFNSGVMPSRIYFAAPMPLYGTAKYSTAITRAHELWPGAEIVSVENLYHSLIGLQHSRGTPPGAMRLQYF